MARGKSTPDVVRLQNAAGVVVGVRAEKADTLRGMGFTDPDETKPRSRSNADTTSK